MYSQKLPHMFFLNGEFVIYNNPKNKKLNKKTKKFLNNILKKSSEVLRFIFQKYI